MRQKIIQENSRLNCLREGDLQLFKNLEQKISNARQENLELREIIETMERERKREE
jgi:hypothetical protein